MKPFNWTDCENPCFDGYNPDPMSMTKDEFIEQAESIEDCDCYDHRGCGWKKLGGVWKDCPSGGRSRYCDWLPKEATDAGPD